MAPIRIPTFGRCLNTIKIEKTTPFIRPAVELVGSTAHVRQTHFLKIECVLTR